nr:hypothetical protein [Tanacetum cinerariifolium]
GSSQNKIVNKGYWDSGCFRHMTGNISYLSDYEAFDGGYMSFGQGGCMITGKGTIKTGKLEFENVYFVKDLKYNLFSVSQICDNKNNVLFTDSECIVLGRDIKLLDDANIFLRTPRRLGHLNFKTMNKLVRHNLVRGLPTKCFENDRTCTACLKGKQHKASCNKPQDHCSTEVPEDSGNPNPTASTSTSLADQIETLTVETPIPTISLPVPTAYSTDSQKPSRPSQKSDNRSCGYSNSNQEQVQTGGRTEFYCHNPSENKSNSSPILSILMEEEIDYNEVFAPVARIEAIRLFLAYASFTGFTVYQMDVKSAFLYGTIDEEVYVMKPPGF